MHLQVPQPVPNPVLLIKSIVHVTHHLKARVVMKATEQLHKSLLLPRLPLHQMLMNIISFTIMTQNIWHQHRQTQ